MLSFRRLIGLAGVARTENEAVRRTGIVFNWLLLVIAFWLPIEWYLQVSDNLPIVYRYLTAWCVWSLFILETVVMTSLVKRKVKYLLTNWLNLVIIIFIFPLWISDLGHSQVAHFMRFLILVRVIIPWLKSARYALTLNRVGLTFTIFLIVTSLSGILMTTIDRHIRNPFDGIWWAWETVTTVGYGDMIPNTVAGKLLAMFVMLMGIVLFSIVTATVSAYFVEKDNTELMKRVMKSNAEKINAMESYLREEVKNKIFSSERKLNQFIESLTEEEKKRLIEVLYKKNQ